MPTANPALGAVIELEVSRAPRVSRTVNFVPGRSRAADIKRDTRSATILRDGRAVFNIAGNKHRIVVWINYPYRVVYVRFIDTRRRYDAINSQTI